MDIKIDDALLKEMLDEVRALTPAQIESRLDRFAGRSMGECLSSSSEDSFFHDTQFLIGAGICGVSQLPKYFDSNSFVSHEFQWGDVSNDDNYALAA